MSIDHILIGKHHGGSDYWRTPFLLFRNLHGEFSFTLDGAATEHDTLLPRFTDNIGNQSWNGERVFCNPPYSNIKTFLSKASEADLAVFLIPHRPHTTYWLNHIYANPFAMKSAYFIVQSNTRHQQDIMGLPFAHHSQVQL